MNHRLLSLFVCSLLGACTPGVNLIEDPPDESDMPVGQDMAQDLSDPSDMMVDMSKKDMTSSKDMDEDMSLDMGKDLGTDMGVDMGTMINTARSRYAHDRLVSPITPSVASTLKSIRGKSTAPKDNIFMKVGASGTVSTRLLNCFAPSSSFNVDLQGNTELQPTIDYFNMGDAAGKSPFIRTTLAAKVGKTAAWVQAGSPSPLDQEIAAIGPRFALVNYGTNDMQQASSYKNALFPFYENMVPLLDGLMAKGIIPIVTGLNPRGDKADAALWVPTFNTLIRAMAEARQLPFIDLYLAVKDLPNQGLVSDGIHGNSFSQGGSQPCIFTPEGLQFNYNIRNLLTLQTLHEVKLVTLDGDMAMESPSPWKGTGKQNDPIEINGLPFTHASNTKTNGQSLIDAYPQCDTGQNESGPELYYKLTLNKRSPVRLMVFDEVGVDVDIHLLGESGDPMTCMARHNKTIERTLDAGVYTIVVDTFVSSSGKINEGDYTFIALECEAGDTTCQ